MSTVRLNLLEHGRATEWLTSSVALVFGITLMLPGDSFYSPAWRVFGELGFSEMAVGIPAILLGSLRMLALYLNGTQPRRSPLIRMVGAILGAASFAAIGAAFLWPSIENGAPFSTAVATYLVLACFDALSAYRSGADVRFGYQLSDKH